MKRSNIIQYHSLMVRRKQHHYADYLSVIITITYCSILHYMSVQCTCFLVDTKVQVQQFNPRNIKDNMHNHFDDIKLHDTRINKNHNENILGKNDDSGEESYVEHQLRKFFLNTDGDLFTFAEKVMESFLSKEEERARNKSSNKPILQRCEKNDTNNNNKENEINGCLMAKSSSEATAAASLLLMDPLFSNNKHHHQSSYSINNKENYSTQFNSNHHHKKGQSFKITIAYKGSAFCGWQIQPHNIIPSVQQTLIDILNPILLNPSTDNKDSIMKPIDIRVCGRTDAGVSAIAQICRVRTIRSLDEVTPFDIQRRINMLGKGNLYCTYVKRVNAKFHPTFGAKSRAYVYLINSSKFNEFIHTTIMDVVGDVTMDRVVSILNKMLSRVEGLELDYVGLSYGKVKTSTTICTLYRARVNIVTMNNNQEHSDISTSTDEAICFEFVGNRFLRRMIRIMVSTLLSLVLQYLIDEKNMIGQETNVEDLFLKLIQHCDRRLSSKPAASDGLIFVGGSFENESI